MTGLRASAPLIAIFAKAPQPGRVKTRLAVSIGEDAASRLHGRLVEKTIATVLAADCGVVELHGTPAGHAVLRSIARRYGIAMRAQSGGNIGTRMHQAFRRGLRRHRRMILVGTDCPALACADVRRAARWLRSCDAVFAPAEDGGYPLIGLARNSPRLFDAIAWSTAAVMGETRQRLAALGWRWRELRTLWDVDRPEDLERLRVAGLLDWPRARSAGGG
ncbi:MAG: TIGR04282 family arsenosugar biosynthesis glycosyltransferase [Betaproteobacteria bacterium]